MNNSHTGMTFVDCLLLIFIVLKLTHVIDWPWIWVLSPLWISLLILAITILIIHFIDYFPRSKDVDDWFKYK